MHHGLKSQKLPPYTDAEEHILARLADGTDRTTAHPAEPENATLLPIQSMPLVLGSLRSRHGQASQGQPRTVEADDGSRLMTGCLSPGFVTVSPAAGTRAHSAWRVTLPELVTVRL